MSFKDISNLELLRPFCSAEHNYLCNLVEGLMRNTTVKLFRIRTSGSGEAFKRYFLSGALAALLFSDAEPFVQFW